MAIVVTPPLDTPINIVLNAVAGGDLAPNTTYYIRVVALAHDYLGSYGEYRYDRGVYSEPSVEDSVATTLTDKTIEVAWDAVGGAAGYDVYITTISGDYDSVNSGRTRYAPLGVWTRTCDGPSVSISAMPDTSGTYEGLIRHTFASGLQFPLNIETGTISVSFDGNITLQDIKDQIDLDGLPNYCLYDGCNFILKGHLYITGTNAGSLTCKSVKLTLIHGEMKNANPNVTLQFGEIRTAYSDNAPCHITVVGRTTVYAGPNDLHYGTILTWGLWDTYNYINGKERMIIGTQAGKFYLEIGAYATDFLTFLALHLGEDTSNFTGRKPGDYNLLIYKPNVTIEDFVAFNGMIVPQVIPAGPVTLKNFTRVYGPNIDIQVFANTTVVNCYNGTYYNTVGNTPRISWRGTHTGTANIYSSFDLTVQDVDGVAISGATVIIVDVNGDAVPGSPFTTDVNGQISTDLLRILITRADPGGPADGDSVEYTPHTVTITKNGYVGRSIIYDMNQKRVEVEMLERYPAPIDHAITIDITEDSIIGDIIEDAIVGDIED